MATSTNEPERKLVSSKVEHSPLEPNFWRLLWLVCSVSTKWKGTKGESRRRAV